MLEQLSASARLHEESREYAEARSDWLKALELLPADASQAKWISDNLRRLETLAAAATAKDRNAWARRFGPFAPLIVLLANSKFLLVLFKLKFLLSLGAFVAFYWVLYGVRFGIGFAVLILVHEMGHFIEIKRRGLPAEMPVFLPGLGAYVRWTALGVSTQTRALVSLAGPMAGCLGAAVCALIWAKTGDALWLGLASLSAMLNVLNLIPIWVLDGSQAIIALNRNQRIVLSAAAVLMAAYFSQPLFLLVAAGAAYRLFTKDIPQAPSHAATVYYLIVLTALGYLIALAPLPAAA
jgi:Zn-dependent protease